MSWDHYFILGIKDMPLAFRTEDHVEADEGKGTDLYVVDHGMMLRFEAMVALSGGSADDLSLDERREYNKAITSVVVMRNLAAFTGAGDTRGPLLIEAPAILSRKEIQAMVQHWSPADFAEARAEFYARGAQNFSRAKRKDWNV
jgi:hypothetical protein